MFLKALGVHATGGLSLQIEHKRKAWYLRTISSGRVQLGHRTIRVGLTQSRVPGGSKPPRSR